MTRNKYEIESDERRARVLRTALNLYAKYPEMGCPSTSYHAVGFHFNGETAQAEATAFRRQLALGTWKKGQLSYGSTSTLTATWLGDVEITLYVEVPTRTCTVVVSGAVAS